MCMCVCVCVCVCAKGHGQQVVERVELKIVMNLWSFPGGSVVKNPPANAGDMGSVPDPGRSHMPWNS